MDCPHCKDEVLVAIEYDRVEVDYCAVCKGIWLDAGELELLFGDREAAEALLSIGSPVELPASEAPRKCPICDTVMTKEATTEDPPVIFDHCPNADGMWLDHGELETILSQGASDGEAAEVRSLLKKMFGKSE
jgi:Zn-finger nucleic acid-binding protein